ncbi:hypothetical protein ACQKMN_17340 [Ureibacillus composti]
MSKVIYIVLTETSTVLARAIKLYTQENFSHVSIAFDLELKEMYSFGRKNENNPFIGGFIQENPSSRLMSNAYCAVYSCPVTNEQYEKLKAMVEHYQSNKRHFKYNFIGLFFVACQIRLKRDNAFFCSQFIATLLQQVGLSLAGRCPYLIKPADFAKLPYIHLCYTGLMRNYTKINGDEQPAPIPVSAIHRIA